MAQVWQQRQRPACGVRRGGGELWFLQFCWSSRLENERGLSGTVLVFPISWGFGVGAGDSPLGSPPLPWGNFAPHRRPHRENSPPTGPHSGRSPRGSPPPGEF
ncbi:hypothetical protein PIB30_057118 [Stylosanthes scabra]|uniref:Uncharacterized protein n=1 Tax=Stylosanthes scabra TaxID=79078 RepID=A0ABU6QLC5_9FABA|nr:hypothetical protein [Stylosanthes scabra]